MPPRFGKFDTAYPARSASLLGGVNLDFAADPAARPPSQADQRGLEGLACMCWSKAAACLDLLVQTGKTTTERRPGSASALSTSRCARISCPEIPSMSPRDLSMRALDGALTVPQLVVLPGSPSRRRAPSRLAEA
ncbi:MAG: hypothetical protein WKF82_06065 [Nocardioidaceae bacterium]